MYLSSVTTAVIGRKSLICLCRLISLAGGSKLLCWEIIGCATHSVFCLRWWSTHWSTKCLTLPNAGGTTYVLSMSIGRLVLIVKIQLIQSMLNLHIFL